MTLNKISGNGDCDLQHVLKLEVQTKGAQDGRTGLEKCLEGIVAKYEGEVGARQDYEERLRVELLHTRGQRQKLELQEWIQAVEWGTSNTA